MLRKKLESRSQGVHQPKSSESWGGIDFVRIQYSDLTDSML